VILDGVNFSPPAPTCTVKVSPLAVGSEKAAAAQTMNASLNKFLIFLLSFHCDQRASEIEEKFGNGLVTVRARRTIGERSEPRRG